MLRPNQVAEEIAIGRFLDYFNQINKSSYEIIEWLDRPPLHPEGPTPDCLCVDRQSGAKLVIERTTLIGRTDRKLTQGAEKLLREVAALLQGKLPGVFRLHDWVENELAFSAKSRSLKIAELCSEILAAASNLAESDETHLSQPFPVTLKREVTNEFNTDSALIWSPIAGIRPNTEFDLVKQFNQILEEAHQKFADHIDKRTVLLINIFDSDHEYQDIQDELFRPRDMKLYPNIDDIYLSEGLPDPPIYKLWPRP